MKVPSAREEEERRRRGEQSRAGGVAHSVEWTQQCTWNRSPTVAATAAEATANIAID